MNEARPDPQDVEFLASQDQDQPLAAPQRDAYDAALAESETLRAFAADLKRIQDWLGAWGSTVADLDVDVDSFAGHVRDRIATSAKDEDDLRTIDGWLARLESAPDAMDSDQFVGDVMQRVAPTVRRRFVSSRWLRLGVPLAAAAAIVFALVGPFRSGTAGRLGTADRSGTGGSDQLIVEIGTTATTSAEREEAVLVAFARTAASVGVLRESESRVSFLSFGASVRATVEEPPPL